MYAAVLTSLVLAGGSLSPPEVWLESELRRRYSTVTQWQIREVLPPRAAHELHAELFEVGPLGSRTLVSVHGRDENGRPAVARHWYEVAGFAPGVVMTRQQGALTVVTPDMVTVTSVDVMAQSCAPLGEGASAVGMRLLQSRHQGDALCASMLGPVPAVARGKTVLVQVKAGSVVLRTEAVARTDAGVGERVLLYRSSTAGENSGGSFWGVVTAPGEVRIDE
jgi:flagella basal body P-ring formation protein FlgA